MSENETSSRLEEILVNLNNQQLRFVVEMPNHTTKKSCAAELGIPIQTVYNWGDEVDEAIEFINEQAKDGWLTLDIKRSKGGKTYMQVDTYVPSDRQQNSSGQSPQGDDAPY